MVQESGTRVGRVMDITGMAGVQFYDIEAHFAGDLSAWSFSARYKQNTDSTEQDLFSGGFVPRYDSSANETIVGGRTAQQPIAAGGYIRFSTNYSGSIMLNVLP